MKNAQKDSRELIETVITYIEGIIKGLNLGTYNDEISEIQISDMLKEIITMLQGE